MSDLIGKSLGRYHILEQIGEGGMATVYKAHDTRLEADVAVKVIRTENLPPNVLERALKRFEREAKALARLTHPNIVKVTDYGEFEGKPYFVIPYLPGGSLKKRLGKPIPWQEAFQFILPIARALDYAHRQNMIHRDVKPSNILITADGEPMLTDFGIAKVLDLEETADLTGTGMGIGTPEYMAPEQWQGNASTQSDLYSLGVLLYEMITGRKPFTANTPAGILLKQATEPLSRPSGFVKNLPDKVENILIKVLARDLSERYKDMGDLVKALDESLNLSTGRIKHGSVYMPSIGSKTDILETMNQTTGSGILPAYKIEPQFDKKSFENSEIFTKKHRTVLLPVYIFIGFVVLISSIFFGNYNLDSAQSITTPTFEFSPIPTLQIFNPTPTAFNPTPTSLPDQIIDDKGIPMLLVPAGEFTMGSDNLDEEERPVHQVYLDAFYMDKYEVTNHQYKKCVNAGACEPPSKTGSYTRSSYFGNSQYDDYPVNFVDWYQATSYCNWRGARLPTEAEWEKSARGTDARSFPWGSNFQCQNGNFDDEIRLRDEFFIPGGPNCDGYEDTAPVGVFENGKSPFEIYDLSGNVWEWVSDWYAENYFTESPYKNPQGPSSGELRVLKGGSWGNYDIHSVHAATRSKSEPTSEYYVIGFRCTLSVSESK